MKKIILYLLLFCFGVPAGQAGSETLVFAPHWLPQAQFAGYYVAQDQGFYTEAGLDVEIIHPSAAVNAIHFLEDGRADVISLFLVTALEALRNGLDLVNIAQISQHSAIMFVSMKDSGIETLEDFEGKKVGVWMSGFREVPEALMQSRDIAVEWVPILSTVNLFLLGGLDVMTVMWYNEYNQLYLTGIDRDEMNTFFLADYGFDIPEDGLYVLEHTLEERPEDLRAFVEATLRGWEYAAANREYAVQLVVDLMRKNYVSSNRAHQRWMLSKVLETHCLQDKEVQVSQLHPDDFQHTVSIIESIRNVAFPVQYHDFFKPVLPGIRKPQ